MKRILSISAFGGLSSVFLFAFFALAQSSQKPEAQQGKGEKKNMFSFKKENRPENLEKATFAGGCFWCLVKPFHKYEGVYTVVSGYTGGDEANPSYNQVSRGQTEHAEAVQIEFNPNEISYADLLEIFWRTFDPTDAGGQFADRGKHYRPVIFFHNEEQRKTAEASKAKLEASKRFKEKIVVPIVPAKAFYAAEDYHQDYYKKNAEQYEGYYQGSGRADFLKNKWGKDLEYKPTKQGSK